MEHENSANGSRPQYFTWSPEKKQIYLLLHWRRSFIILSEYHLVQWRWILMPQIKSAIKRVSTSAARRDKNAAEMSKLITAVKKFKAAQAAGADNASELHKEAVRALDKAASKGLIHKNKASRDKSRLAKLAK